jgi:hypothetical protein
MEFVPIAVWAKVHLTAAVVNALAAAELWKMMQSARLVRHLKTVMFVRTGVLLSLSMTGILDSLLSILMEDMFMKTSVYRHAHLALSHLDSNVSIVAQMAKNLRMVCVLSAKEFVPKSVMPQWMG